LVYLLVIKHGNGKSPVIKSTNREFSWIFHCQVCLWEGISIHVQQKILGITWHNEPHSTKFNGPFPHPQFPSEGSTKVLSLKELIPLGHRRGDTFVVVTWSMWPTGFTGPCASIRDSQKIAILPEENGFPPQRSTRSTGGLRIAWGLTGLH
jgi:hypothetical protein